MGIGGFLKTLGFGTKPKAEPFVIGSQNGPVPEQVLNARPKVDFVQPTAAEPLDDGGKRLSEWLSAEEANELTVTDSEGRPNLRLVWRDESLRFTVGDTGRFITAGSRQLPRFGIWAFNVRGTNYRPGNGRTEETSPRSKLKLVREPSNEYDPNAIAVHSERGKILGYVNKGNATRMTKLLDKGTEFEVISLHGSRRGHESIGVTVLATNPEMLNWLFRRC